MSRLLTIHPIAHPIPSSIIAVVSLSLFPFHYALNHCQRLFNLRSSIVIDPKIDADPRSVRSTALLKMPESPGESSPSMDSIETPRLKRKGDVDVVGAASDHETPRATVSMHPRKRNRYISIAWYV